MAHQGEIFAEVAVGHFAEGVWRFILAEAVFEMEGGLLVGVFVPSEPEPEIGDVFGYARLAQTRDQVGFGESVCGRRFKGGILLEWRCGEMEFRIPLDRHVGHTALWQFAQPLALPHLALVQQELIAAQRLVDILLLAGAAKRISVEMAQGVAHRAGR